MLPSTMTQRMKTLHLHSRPLAILHATAQEESSKNESINVPCKLAERVSHQGQLHMISTLCLRELDDIHIHGLRLALCIPFQ